MARVMVDELELLVTVELDANRACTVAHLTDLHGWHGSRSLFRLEELLAIHDRQHAASAALHSHRHLV